jgi:hypothetical protein
MRNWIVSLRIAMFIVFCGISAGIVGCTKDPQTKEKGVAKIQPAAKVDLDDQKKVPVAKEVPAKQLVVRGDDVSKHHGARDVAPKGEPDAQEQPAAKEVFAKEFTPVELQESKKKPKDTGKETKKDPSKNTTKDTSKEPKTPEYKEPTEILGKSFKDWMKDMKSPDPSKRDMAMKNIVLFGPKKSYEAVKEIIKQLERQTIKREVTDLSVRVTGIVALSTILKYKGYKDCDPKDIDAAYAVYKYFLKDPQVIMKVRAVQGIPSLGPKAREAIDEVIKVAQDGSTWEVRKDGLQTLTILAAPDKQWGVPHHAKALPVAHAALADSSYLVRMTAVQALAVLNEGKVPPEYYHLGKCLDDPSIQVRLEVLKNIATLAPNMDPKGKDQVIAVNRLTTYLNAEKDDILKIWTHATIMTVLKKVTKLNLDPVISRLKHKDPAVRVQALTVIGLGGKDSRPIALSAVRSAVEDKDTNVGVAAIVALVQMDAVECVPMLEKIEEDKKANEALKATASNALDEFHKRKLEGEKKDKSDKKTPDKK